MKIQVALTVFTSTCLCKVNIVKQAQFQPLFNM